MNWKRFHKVLSKILIIPLVFFLVALFDLPINKEVTLTFTPCVKWAAAYMLFSLGYWTHVTERYSKDE